MKPHNQNDQVINRSPSFRRSPEADICIKVLSAMPVGEVVTYTKLFSETGIPEDNDARLRGVLNTARSALQRDEQKVFLPVNGVGLKRLNDTEIVESGRALVRRAERMSNKGLKRTLCANPEELSKETRQEFSIVTATLSALAKVSGRKVQNKLLQHAMDHKGTLHAGDIFRLPVLD